MVKNPVLLVAILLLIEIFVLTISSRERLKRFFKFLPPVFWIYALPMLGSNAGIIDAKSPVYQAVSVGLLPMALLLLLIPVDIRAIMRLGGRALIMFFAGGVGIVLGAALVFRIFKKTVGEEFWSGFGALSGSWTGGSANMVAVKEALGTPDEVFSMMVIVDTIVPYVWMGVLVALAARQGSFDRWVKADKNLLDDLNANVVGFKKAAPVAALKFSSTLVILGIGVLGAFWARALGMLLPEISGVVSHYAWTIIIVSLAGVGMSFTRLRRLEEHGIGRIGYFILYFVLTTIGAKSSLASADKALVLIIAGFLIVLVHAVVLLISARIVRAPMFLVATASQANLGGVASAPIVAEIYREGLSSVGLLMAVLGNIVGTYLGIIAGQLCRALG